MRNGLLWILLLAAFGSMARGGTIAWFYALDSDKAAFEKLAGKPLRSVTSGSVTMQEYRVGPHRVVAAKMGSGCVQTATTVSVVVALNPPDRVISTGPAGGLSKGAELGGWLRVEEVVAWQKGRAGAGGKISLREGSTVKVDFQERDWPEGDWKKATAARITSGEGFVASGEVRAEISAETGAVAVEMNAFGLVTALKGSAAKVLILRVVSDRADESASEDFAAFVAKDEGEGGKMVAEMVRNLPVDGNEPAAHDGLRELLEGK